MEGEKLNKSIVKPLEFDNYDDLDVDWESDTLFSEEAFKVVEELEKTRGVLKHTIEERDDLKELNKGYVGVLLALTLFIDIDMTYRMKELSSDVKNLDKMKELSITQLKLKSLLSKLNALKG